MNVAPQKHDFINLDDLQNLSKRFSNHGDQNSLKVNSSQFNELYEANKTDTIYITEADIKEYNKRLATQKAEEILKDYTQNLIQSNNKIYSDEPSNGFNKNAY